MDDDITFRDYARVMKRYWGWVLLVFILVFGAVAAYTFLSRPVFESTSLVILSNSDQANFILGNSAPKSADIETQMVIIQSPGVMAPIYAQYGMDSFKLFVTNIKNSNIIEIKVQAASAEDATNIVSDIAQSYINYTRQTRKSEAENNVAFITNKIDTYNQEISALDTQITAYKANEALLSPQQKMEYQNLQREMSAKSKIYDYLLTKREEAGITANIESANINTIQPASFPLYPVRPNKPLNLVLGFLLAIGAGAITASMIDNSRERRA